ncbi:MFS general substrate transporter [Meredithblackwellia eburnea MCA 4105]
MENWDQPIAVSFDGVQSESAAEKGHNVLEGPGRELSLKSLELEAQSEGITPIFLAKVNVINNAISECGMGRYQYLLFFSAGLGWMADNCWLQAVAILMPAVANQDGFPRYPGIRMLTCALYSGLILGALFWGFSADVIGRRLSWNLTLYLSGIFGLLAGTSPNFTVLGMWLALLGFAVGGNLPTDSALFLEFIPGSHQYLLTFLSCFWAIGQVIASLIGWVFVANYSCDSALVGAPGYRCDDGNNSGWRYSYYTLGAMMLFLATLRVFVLPMDETPKYLVSIGRDRDAVDVVHKIAKMNGKTSSLTVADLHDAAVPYFRFDGDGDQVTTKFSPLQLAINSIRQIDGEHIRALFKTRRLAYSTSLILFCYASLGLAFPMWYAFLGTYLTERNADLGDTSVDATYGPYAYQSAFGVIGSVMAAALVQWNRGGRKFAMAFFTVLSGVFLFAMTAAKTSVQINALTCVVSLTSNAFYGVLYGYAPEVFPTTSRGTGDALAAAASRVTGIFAPIIAVYSPAARSPNGPVYASAGIFVATGFIMLALPIETVGKTAR